MEHARNFKDITGQKFNSLTVIKYDKSYKNVAYWICQCKCGKTISTMGQSLRSGNTKSCGCLKDEVRLLRCFKHGKSKTPEFTSWTSMLKRCLNQNDNSFYNYGGRGIKICAAYQSSFMNFFNDLGERPSNKYSVDRKDYDLDYSCGKCDECKGNGWNMNIHWGTRREQSRNTRQNVWYEYNGLKMVATDWASHFGVPNITFVSFMETHSIEEAVKHYTTPNKKGRKLYEYEDFSMTQTEWSKKLNVKLSTFARYLKKHKSVEKTVLHFSNANPL